MCVGMGEAVLFIYLFIFLGGGGGAKGKGKGQRGGGGGQTFKWLETDRGAATRSHPVPPPSQLQIL